VEDNIALHETWIKHCWPTKIPFALVCFTLSCPSYSQQVQVFAYIAISARDTKLASCCLATFFSLPACSSPGPIKIYKNRRAATSVAYYHWSAALKMQIKWVKLLWDCWLLCSNVTWPFCQLERLCQTVRISA